MSNGVREGSRVMPGFWLRQFLSRGRCFFRQGSLRRSHRSWVDELPPGSMWRARRRGPKTALRSPELKEWEMEKVLRGEEGWPKRDRKTQESLGIHSLWEAATVEGERKDVMEAEARGEREGAEPGKAGG